MGNIIGDSICVFRIKVEVEDGFDAAVARAISRLQDGVKGGRFGGDYQYSVADFIRRNVAHVSNVEMSGPRSSIAIPLRVIKTFAPENAVAFSSKIGGGACGKAIVDFLRAWGVAPAMQVAENCDSHVEFKCVSPRGDLSEVVIKTSPSKAFKHNFDLQKIEETTGLLFDTLLLNRPRAGFERAADIVRRRRNPLISLVVHDYSKYQSARDYLKYIGKSDYVFITAQDGDNAVTARLANVLNAPSYEALGEAVVNFNTAGGGTRERMFLLPPAANARGGDKFVSFHLTGMKPVKVEVPDKVRLKLKTAWLNGACVALARKDWRGRAPFGLNGVLPASQADFETFANWAMNMAYEGYPPPDYKPAKNLILK